MKRRLMILLLMGAMLTGYGQTNNVVERIIEIGKTDNQTMQHLDVLCNRFGGRLVGSDAFENAAEWATYKFENWGMEVIKDEAGEVPVGFNRGPWFGRKIGRAHV